MVKFISVPLLIAGSISLIFSIIYTIFFIKTRRHDRENSYYLFFSILSFSNAVFSISFFGVMNIHDINLGLILVNRFTIIGAIFNFIFWLHFVKIFFNYTHYKFDLYILYPISVFFALGALINTRLFIYNEIVQTSRYYTTLKYGPGFNIWLIFSFCVIIYSLHIVFSGYYYNRELRSQKSILYLVVNSILWMLMGMLDALTTIRILDLPPISCYGSILVVMAIAIILIMNIERLYEKTGCDGLTGVYSRSYFELELEHAYNNIDRSNNKLFLVLLDIDDFKHINDKYGHLCGDLVIKRVAKNLEKGLPDHYTIARYGGDEFVILISDNGIPPKIQSTVDAVRTLIANDTINFDGHNINVTCSFGIAVLDQKHARTRLTQEAMVSSADKALYLSKNQGKNKVNLVPITEE